MALITASQIVKGTEPERSPAVACDPGGSSPVRYEDAP